MKDEQDRTTGFSFHPSSLIPHPSRVTRTQWQIEEHRKGTACLQVRDGAGRPCPGVAVWVEQETHAFGFGCVVPDLGALPEPDRQRYSARLAEVFNRLVPAGQPTDPGVGRYDVPESAHLGRVRVDLDRLAAAGLPLEVHVRGRCVGLGGPESPGVAVSRDRAAAERVAALYTLCFAHPGVGAVVWNGFWDGEEGAADGGLLRRDLAPRPAFQFLRKLIGIAWHTRASGETDADGLFRFRGFFGDYRVAARLGQVAATTALFPFHRGPVPGGAMGIIHLHRPAEGDR
jgi:hypothetical protein